jgi:glycosyltransferase involved in cell wall biosynthesis
MKPLVTVICISYNHERFLKESLNSVFNQTYPSIEVIIVDDASKDGSKAIIDSYLKQQPLSIGIFNDVNKGICASFNKALVLAKGKYIVDLATDDLMELNKIERQVNFFEQLDESYGVVFTNVLHIDENSNPLGLHFKPGDKIPAGDIYKEVIRKFFLPPASLMMRKKLLEELGGYDESLSYEDFDLWVRSSRKYKYGYLNEPLILCRNLKGSLSKKFFKPKETAMLESTYKVCQKALWLNKSKEENLALCRRLRYEMKQAFFMENFALAKKYYQLMKDAGGKNIFSSFIVLLSDLKIRTNFLYSYYLKLAGRL